jgi:hypothetical protein
MYNHFLSGFASILIIFSFGSIEYNFAQAPDTLWTKLYYGSSYDYGEYVQQTNDGGYIISGETKSYGVGEDDIWLIKTNASGDTMWTKTIGGPEGDYANCVRQTSDGGYITFGETISYSSTYWKGWLVKLDGGGDTSWTKLIGQSRHYFIQEGWELNNGNYVFAGYTKASGAGQEDIWLVKTDATGDTIWTNTFGGSEGDVTQSMDVTNDGGFIIAAYTKSFSSGDKDCWLIRTDYKGDTLWTKVIGGSRDDYIYSVRHTSDNGFILAGATQSFGVQNSYYNLWVVKTDYSGDTLWTRTFGGEGNETASSVVVTTDGDYVVAGWSSLGTWLIKLNPSGDTLWTKSLGWGTGEHIEQTTDGGYIILVYKWDNITLADLWLVKLALDPNDVEPLEQGIAPETYLLKQNYPNPFNPFTTIEFNIPKPGLTTLRVYNLLGEQVGELVNENLDAGRYKASWDAKDLPSGVYIYKLSVGEFNQSNKMILMK